MTTQTIETLPYTLNVIYKTDTGTDVETFTYKTELSALKVAREELKWENTIHATITHEPTGKDIFDEKGDFF
jgi:hypothetical protein